MLTREQFLRYLRDALGHLNDPDSLRQSPLASLFEVANRFDTPLTLKRILIKGIESLEPRTDEPSHSRAWRMYESLFYRYVQQFSQQEVAEQLGIGTRHLRREQHAALESLAYQLWQQFGLEKKLSDSACMPRQETEPVQNVPTVNEELAWLKDVSSEGPTDLAQTIHSTLELAQPLADKRQTSLAVKIEEGLPCLAVHPVALSQILLNLVSVAIHRASACQVSIAARLRRWEVEMQVHGLKSSDEADLVSDDDATSLDVTRHLVGLCRCRLDLSDEDGAFCATLTLPALEQVPVLALDDNADTLLLLQRYTAGTRYRLVGTRDPEQLLSLAQTLSPEIIVLDVMMPQVDGWKILARLQQHPRTSHIPILVCTILAQEELALALGANALIRKPLSRQTFLAALDRQLVPMGTESR